MYPIGPIEKTIYKLRAEHPLVIPQLDPDNYDLKGAKQWFEQVKECDIKFIAMGGSMIDAIHTQNVLNMAIKNYDFIVALYLTSNSGVINGFKGRTAVYWMQIPNSQNTFYGWDGLISNSLQVEKHGLEPIPTIYVFDDRDFVGTANWVARGYPIPREKPEISLAVAKAAEYLGIRFYIMAGGSGSTKPPSVKHVEKLAKGSQLFVIPTSGINTATDAKELFAVGADAIHIGNKLETANGFKELKEIVKISKLYPGRNFL